MSHHTGQEPLASSPCAPYGAASLSASLSAYCVSLPPPLPLHSSRLPLPATTWPGFFPSLLRSPGAVAASSQALFTQGRFSKPIVCFSIVFLIYGIILCIVPSSGPNPDPESLNYIVVINMAVWRSVSLHCAIDACKWFTGPKTTIDQGDDDATGSVTTGGVEVIAGRPVGADEAGGITLTDERLSSDQKKRTGE